MYIYGSQTVKYMDKVQKRSYLTLIELLPQVKRKPRMGLYRCECGNTSTAREGEVRTLRILSCGCYSSRRQREAHLKHGLSKHPLYAVWKAMVDRCHTVKNKQYDDYGGRGVVVCKEWRSSFLLFYDWALTHGWQKGLHVDKDTIGNGLLYSPETCVCIPRLKNNRDKRDVTRVEFEGKIVPLPELCERFGMPNQLVRVRIKVFKWGLLKALTTPKGAHKYKK